MKVNRVFCVCTVVTVKGVSAMHIPRLSALVACVMLGMADPCVVTAHPVSSGHSVSPEVPG